MLALAFLLPVAVGWGLYEIFTPEDDDNGNGSSSKTVNGEFKGTEGANNFDGGAGNDTLSGLGGKDTIVGGYGKDIIDGGVGSDRLDGGAGHDIVMGGENNDYIFGGFGDDTLNGDNGDDSIFGEIGEDLIDGGEGSDFIDGGNNDDIIGGFSEADILKGANGNDIMLGNNGNDDLKGQFGNDILVGGGGDDVLAGGSGNDTLMGGGYYLGLDGDQSAEFMAALQAAKADPALLAQYNALTVKSDAVFINSDYFANVDLTREGLDQTDGADTLYAGEGDDVLHIATDRVATGGGGEDEFNVHISQFVSGKPVPLIADFELTEDKIVITYDPAVMSNTTITYTPVENGLLVNVGGASVLKLEGSYTEAQVSSRVSIVEENSTLVTT
jgi:Ca2+-binding RTX toxin-like protein